MSSVCSAKFIGTITVFPAAIPSCHEGFGDRRVFSDPLVKRFQQGFVYRVPFLKQTVDCGALEVSGRPFHRGGEEAQKVLSPMVQSFVLGKWRRFE